MEAVSQKDMMMMEPKLNKMLAKFSWDDTFSTKLKEEARVHELIKVVQSKPNGLQTLTDVWDSDRISLMPLTVKTFKEAWASAWEWHAKLREKQRYLEEVRVRHCGRIVIEDLSR